MEHEIKGAKVISDGSSAGSVVFDLGNGGSATVSASITQPSKSEEPTGGGDPESKAKLAGQKAIAEAEVAGDDLPDGFPSKGVLEAAGITTLPELRAKIATGTPEVPWYDDVAGIAEGKATDIEEALN